MCVYNVLAGGRVRSGNWFSAGDRTDRVMIVLGGGRGSAGTEGSSGLSLLNLEGHPLTVFLWFVCTSMRACVCVCTIV